MAVVISFSMQYLLSMLVLFTGDKQRRQRIIALKRNSSTNQLGTYLFRARLADQNTGIQPEIHTYNCIKNVREYLSSTEQKWLCSATHRLSSMSDIEDSLDYIAVLVSVAILIFGRFGIRDTGYQNGRATDHSWYSWALMGMAVGVMYMML